MIRNPFPTTKTSILTGIVAGGVVAAAVVFFCDPVRMPIYPVCPFHKFTGLACPGCGSLRALHALLHGQWVAALHFNPLLILSLPVLAWFGLRSVASGIRGGPVVEIRPVWLWLYAAAWIAFGILRNLPFPICASLSP